MRYNILLVFLSELVVRQYAPQVSLRHEPMRSRVSMLLIVRLSYSCLSLPDYVS